MITGFFEILAAIDLRKTIANEWLLILNGTLSVIFGVLIALNPGMGALSITWIVEFYAVAFGVMLLGLSWRLRNWHSTKPNMTLTTSSHA